MQTGFATDHGAYVLKEPILKSLRDSGLIVQDFGAFHLDPEDDYPDFVTHWLGRSPKAKWSAVSPFVAAEWVPVSRPTK